LLQLDAMVLMQHPNLSPTDDKYTKAATDAITSMVTVTDCTATWLEYSICCHFAT